MVDFDVTRSLLIDALARRGMIPRLTGTPDVTLTPLEYGGMVAGRMTRLTFQHLQSLVQQGRNVVYDSTMPDIGDVQSVVEFLRDHRYSILGLFVDVPIDHGIAGTQQRWWRGVREYEDHGIGLGGRYVDERYVRGLADPSGTRHSINRANFDVLFSDGAFDGVAVFTNHFVNGRRAPKLEFTEGIDMSNGRSLP
jgi:hypothetical protein